MSQRAHYIRIGLFVLAAAALGIAGVVVLSIRLMSLDRMTIETCIDGSVQGLDIGSAVKYRGVKIGQLDEITFAYAAYATEKRYVLLRMSVAPRLAGSVHSGTLAARALQKEVDLGLRIRINAQGVTGTSYLEMNYIESDKTPMLPIDWKPAYPYIPSAPSMLSRITESFESLMSRLEKIRFDEITDNLNTLLGSLNNLTTNDIAATLQNLKGVSAQLNHILQTTDQDLGPLLKSARAATDRLPDAVGRWSQMLGRADGILGRVDRILGAEQENIQQTVESLRRAADNLNSFSDTAREYPASVLLGKPPAPLKEEPPRK